MLGTEVVDAVVLDLFAGTGALGLEALSRGASRAVFVDRDRQALRALGKNVAAVAPDKVEVLGMPAEQALRLLAGRGAAFDLVFLDPPYDLELLPPTLSRLAALDLVRADGAVVCEHHGKTEPPEPPAGWCEVQRRRYGDVAVVIFRAGKGSAP